MESMTSHIQAFHDAYKQQNYGLAYDAFLAALALDADYAYREIAAPNAAIARVAEMLGQTEALVAILGMHFEACPRMHLMGLNNQDQLDYFSRLRAENIAQGKPSAMLVTMEKSGSISVANIFTSGLNLPSFAYSFLNLAVIESWARDYARGGACYVTHLRPYPENIARLKRAGINKMIVHIRDPRQAMLSLLHHLERYREAFPSQNIMAFRQLTLDEKLALSMDMYMNFIRWIDGWVQASSQIEIQFSTFEQLVTDRDAFTQRYLDFYGPHSRDFNEQNAFTEHAGIDYHKRLGETDEWRRVFSAENQKLLTMLLPASLKNRFGWFN